METKQLWWRQLLYVCNNVIVKNWEYVAHTPKYPIEPFPCLKIVQ